MKFARMRRLLIAAGVGAVALSPLALPASPAHAGQVGVTITIKGAGQVQIVEGELNDGGSKVCDKSDNLNDTVGAVCPRIRSESVLEAWVWMRPVETTPGFSFSGWQGCDVDRVRDGVKECMVRAGAFSGVEHYPVATFTEARPVITDLRFDQGPEQGRLTARFTNSGVDARCALDLDGWVPCGSGSSWVLPEGEHSLSVFGLNRSGKGGSSAQATMQVVDTELFRAPPALTNSRSASLAWSTRSGNAFECAFDGSFFTWCGAGNGGAEELTDLADGNHVWQVRARHGDWVDPTPATHRWTVDTVAPVTTVDARSIDGGRAEVAFSSNDAVRHECRLDVGAWSPCTSPVVYDGLPDGQHVVDVRGYDAAGNAATPATTAWGVDRGAPDASITGGPAPGSFSLGSSARFAVRADDPDATLTCTLDGRPRPCTPGTLRLTGLRPGTHTVTVGATDGAGNADATPATRTWTVPYSAAAFSRGRSWRAVRTGSAYGGVALTSTTKNAALTRRVSGARRVALVVGGGERFGVVRVYAGRKLLRTVKLTARRTIARRVVPVATFRTPYSGALRVVVASSGRPVRVEGIGVSTR